MPSAFTEVGIYCIFDIFANADDARVINMCALRDTHRTRIKKTRELMESMEKGSSPMAWQKKARRCLLSPRERNCQNLAIPVSWPEINDAKVVVTHLLKEIQKHDIRTTMLEVDVDDIIQEWKDENLTLERIKEDVNASLGRTETSEDFKERLDAWCHMNISTT